MAKKAAKKSPAKKPSAVTALARAASAKKAESLERKKKRGAALVALIDRRKARIVEDFYDIGEALRELLRSALYAALGYASFEELVEANELMSYAQANKLVAIVDRVPREEALRAGMEKAYALISYAAASPSGDSVAALIGADAIIEGKPVSQASVREIVAATRKVRPAPKKTAADRERAKSERAMLALVREILRAGGDAPRARVSVEGDEVVARWSFRALERHRGEP